LVERGAEPTKQSQNMKSSQKSAKKNQLRRRGESRDRVPYEQFKAKAQKSSMFVTQQEAARSFP
jgi:hypothetical protein